jgi:multisubunit Na+/H+ antiporter MnhG subunit
MMMAWTLAAVAAGLYCIARAVVDLRQRKYAWGGLGLAAAAVFLLTPVQSHAIKVDLPAGADR